MPNIEVYGFNQGSKEETVILSAVVIILQKTQYKDEIVITTIPSYCVNLDGKSMPFLRICDTDEERMKDIAKGLKQIKPGIDIELLKLAGFYEAESASFREVGHF